MDVRIILGKTQSPRLMENDALYPGSSTRNQLLNSGLFSFDRYFEGIRRERKERNPPYMSSFGTSPINSGSTTPHSLGHSPSAASKYFSKKSPTINRPYIGYQETVAKIRSRLSQPHERISVKLPPLKLHKSQSQTNSKEFLNINEKKDLRPKNRQHMKSKSIQPDEKDLQTPRNSPKNQTTLKSKSFQPNEKKLNNSVMRRNRSQMLMDEDEKAGYTSVEFDFKQAETLRMEEYKLGKQRKRFNQMRKIYKTKNPNASDFTDLRCRRCRVSLN